MGTIMTGQGMYQFFLKVVGGESLSSLVEEADLVEVGVVRRITTRNKYATHKNQNLTSIDLTKMCLDPRSTTRNRLVGSTIGKMQLILRWIRRMGR